MYTHTHTHAQTRVNDTTIKVVDVSSVTCKFPFALNVIPLSSSQFPGTNKQIFTLFHFRLFLYFLEFYMTKIVLDLFWGWYGTISFFHSE